MIRIFLLLMLKIGLLSLSMKLVLLIVSAAFVGKYKMYEMIFSWKEGTLNIPKTFPKQMNPSIAEEDKSGGYKSSVGEKVDQSTSTPSIEGIQMKELLGSGNFGQVDNHSLPTEIFKGMERNERWKGSGSEDIEIRKCFSARNHPRDECDEVPFCYLHLSLSSMQHKYIISYIEFAPQMNAVVMELAAGTLQHFLDQSTMPICTLVLSSHNSQIGP